MQAKALRNKAIVILREVAPEDFTFRELGKLLGVKESTVHEIYMRDREKYTDKSQS